MLQLPEVFADMVVLFKVQVEIKNGGFITKNAFHTKRLSLLTMNTKFFDQLATLTSEAYAHQTQESPLYALWSHIYSEFCSKAIHIPRRTFHSAPQPTFTIPNDSNDLSKAERRRIPDFAALISFYQPRNNVSYRDPEYKRPQLAFWSELKQLDSPHWWFDDPALVLARGTIKKHLPQLGEQASWAFHQYDGDNHFCFLIVGIFFSLFKYSRPAEIPPPSSRIESIPMLPPRPDISPPSSPPSIPMTPPKRSFKRPRVDSSSDLEPQLLPPVGDPEPLYYNELAFLPNFSGFHPRFLKALELVTGSDVLELAFELSDFTVPEDSASEPSKSSIVSLNSPVITQLRRNCHSIMLTKC
jgi:hypothetical protein